MYIFAWYRKHVRNHMSDDSGNLFFTISVLRTPGICIYTYICKTNTKNILTWLISSLSLSSFNSSKVTGLVMTALRQNEVTWLQNLYHEYIYTSCMGVYSPSVYAWVYFLTSVDIQYSFFFFYVILYEEPVHSKRHLELMMQIYVPGLTKVPSPLPLSKPPALRFKQRLVLSSKRQLLLLEHRSSQSSRRRECLSLVVVNLGWGMLLETLMGNEFTNTGFINFPSWLDRGSQRPKNMIYIYIYCMWYTFLFYRENKRWYPSNACNKLRYLVCRLSHPLLPLL